MKYTLYSFCLILLISCKAKKTDANFEGEKVGESFNTVFIAEEKFDYGNESIMEDANIDKEELRDFVFDLIQKVKIGELKAFSSVDPTLELTSEELDNIWLKRDTIFDYNPETGVTTSIPYEDKFEIEQITHLRFNEKWFYDEENEKMYKEVVAVCPMIMSFSPQGEYRGKVPLFWIPLN